MTIENRTETKKVRGAHPRRLPVLRPGDRFGWVGHDFAGQRLYIATPKSMFRTPGFFNYIRDLVEAGFPQAELVWGISAFSSNEDWRARWLSVLASMDGLIVAADIDRYIGQGVYQEMMDAAAAGKPVGVHTRHGRFVPLAEVTFEVLDPGTRMRYARLGNTRGRVG